MQAIPSGNPASELATIATQGLVSNVAYGLGASLDGVAVLLENAVRPFYALPSNTALLKRFAYPVDPAMQVRPKRLLRCPLCGVAVDLHPGRQPAGCMC